jgi:hypothetical protein
LVQKGGLGRYWTPDTHHETILVNVQFFHDRLNRLIRWLVLDNLESVLQIRQRDLTVLVALYGVERRTNFLVIGLQLSVDLLDHATDTFVERSLRGVCFLRVELGFLREAREISVINNRGCVLR